MKATKSNKDRYNELLLASLTTKDLTRWTVEQAMWIKSYHSPRYGEYQVSFKVEHAELFVYRVEIHIGGMNAIHFHVFPFSLRWKLIRNMMRACNNKQYHKFNRELYNALSVEKGE